MSNRDLLKEAIADAKAVKEIAITNAKAALEEAFTPHLMSMFEQKLTEMEDESEKKHSMEEKMHDDEHEDTMEEELDEDLELEALLRELEEAEKEEESEEEESEEEETEEEESEEEESEEVELDFDEMEKNPEKFTEMIEKIVDEVIDEMIADGELEAGHPGMEDEAGAMEPEMGAEEEAGEDMEMPLDEAKKKHAKEMKEKEEKMKKMEEELKEARTALKTIQSELNEVNVLNSKLLYVNKIFKAQNLTENQKVHVLAAFDKAETVKESKLIYETLKDNLAKTSNVKKKEFISESKSFASKSVGTSPKQPVVETNPMVERFKKLAGL